MSYNLLIDTEYKYIQKELMNALVLHVDESPIKINGEQYYLHNISDGKHTLQYVTKHRSKDDVNKFGFLSYCTLYFNIMVYYILRCRHTTYCCDNILRCFFYL